MNRQALQPRRCLGDYQQTAALHAFTPSPTTPTDRDRSRSNGAARADTADGAEDRQEGLLQQADQAEPAAEPVPPQVAAVAALGQAAQRWQRGVEAAVHGMGQEVAAQALREGPPARTPPVFGGGLYFCKLFQYYP